MVPLLLVLLLLLSLLSLLLFSLLLFSLQLGAGKNAGAQQHRWPGGEAEDSRPINDLLWTRGRVPELRNNDQKKHAAGSREALKLRAYEWGRPAPRMVALAIFRSAPISCWHARAARHFHSQLCVVTLGLFLSPAGPPSRVGRRNARRQRKNETTTTRNARHRRAAPLVRSYSFALARRRAGPAPIKSSYIISGHPGARCLHGGESRVASGLVSAIPRGRTMASASRRPVQLERR